MPTLLPLGHGYSADALARRLLPEGWHVIGSTRSAAKAEALAGRGVEPLVWEGGPSEALAAAIDRADHLLISAAPKASEEVSGDPVLAAAREAVAERARAFAWVGYLSTIGVYGDRAGGWVDEAAERRPATERGRARVAAEDDWLALHRDTGLGVHVFRLAGIYGPGRGPFEKVRAGTARRIVKDGQVFSRIHVDDIAAVLKASIARPCPGAVYNVCDDEPAPPQDVLAHAAALLGREPPPEVAFEAAELSAMARSFYAESKRVSNTRIKHDLSVALAYPSYREGLAAVLAAEG
ncbi:MAG: SDR family oxidoreductase [Paracoccaceae bacterium]